MFQAMGTAAARVTAIEESAFARDVRAGLDRAGQKELPSKYLYDEVGSALFEVITRLPEYGLTRADERVVEFAVGEIQDYLPGPVTVVELGSGSGRKTRRLIEEVSDHRRPLYMPIDISSAALEWCERWLGDVAEVKGFEANYLAGLEQAVKYRPRSGSLLVLFLGSNIGNFDRTEAEQFLRGIRNQLAPGDSLLVGTDLVKPAAQLLKAYDDPAGVTAAFNLNLLGRLNRELGADFDLRRFRHEARYDAKLRRVEMHLRSTECQTVTIPGADLRCAFRGGETIWTETSNKYVAEELPGLAARTGFRAVASWVDAEWPFAESLWVAARNGDAIV